MKQGPTSGTLQTQDRQTDRQTDGQTGTHYHTNKRLTAHAHAAFLSGTLHTSGLTQLDVLAFNLSQQAENQTACMKWVCLFTLMAIQLKVTYFRPLF